MQRREVLAIRLAVVTGDVARARKAAERLFGLRLDSDTQVQLASQMHQLGMHELAEAVLGRARRRAGGNLAALVVADAPVPAARQARRRRAGGQPGPPPQHRPSQSRLLRRRRRGPHRGRPGPRPLGQDQGDDRPARGTGPADPRLAPAPPAAGRLLQGGRREGQGQARIRRDGQAPPRRRQAPLPDRLRPAPRPASTPPPSSITPPRSRRSPTCSARAIYEIQQAFQQAGKFDDLVKIVEESDIRAIGQVYYVARIIQAVLQDKAKRDRGLALFAKAWKAFPGQRENLFYYVSSEEVWQLPEMYDYLREVVIPAEGRKSVPAWMGVADTLRNTGNGRIDHDRRPACSTSPSGEGSSKLLTDEIERAEKRLPDLARRPGPPRAGPRPSRPTSTRPEPCSRRWPTSSRPTPHRPRVRQVIGQEWEGVPALRPLALTLYEGAVKESEPADSTLLATARSSAWSRCIAWPAGSTTPAGSCSPFARKAGILQPITPASLPTTRSTTGPRSPRS